MKCNVEWCDRKQFAKGFCSKHYQQMMKHGKITKETERVSTTKNTICKIEGCDDKVYCKGLCNKHYQQQRMVTMDADKLSKCKILGCDFPMFAKGLCKTHYNQQYHKPKYIYVAKKCMVKGCQGEVHARGYCLKHYNQIYLYGEDSLEVDKSVITKIKNKSCKVDGCNEVIQAKGYCKIHYNRNRYAERKARKKVVLSKYKVEIKEEIFKKFIGEYGASACSLWTSKECDKCIKNGVGSTSIQFKCEEYRESFDFNEIMRMLVDK